MRYFRTKSRIDLIVEFQMHLVIINDEVVFDCAVVGTIIRWVFSMKYPKRVCRCWLEVVDGFRR